MSSIINKLIPKKQPLTDAIHNTYNLQRNIETNGSFIKKYIHKNGQYKPVILMFGNKQTEVLAYESWNGYYIKPLTAVYDFHYEQFFGFGCGCYGFNKNTTTFVPAFNQFK
jgi:uncharacterized alpha/beta hydrolase family protein